jgi:hypothetical protein
MIITSRRVQILGFFALDEEGKVTFDVSSDIRRGTYKFLAFNISGTADWIRADRILTVH